MCDFPQSLRIFEFTRTSKFLFTPGSMKVAMEKLMRTKRVMTPWKMGTAYQCFSRMYHLTHLNSLCTYE